MKIALLLVVFQFFVVGAWGTCPNVRLDNTTLKSVPVLDQDGSGICWAYSAALLIDAYRFSHGDENTDKITSPIGLAVRSASQDQRATNGSGFVSIALAAAFRDGFVCDHNSVSLIYKSTDFHRSESSKFWTSTFDKPLFANLECPLGGIVDQIIGRQTRNTIGVLREIELTSITNEVKNLCKRQVIDVKLPKPQARNVINLRGFPDRSYVSSFLSARLSLLNPQPVAIAYCEDVLRDKSIRSVDSSGKRVDCKNHHLSVVIGSRPTDDGKCEFLVRNSYGASCVPYAWPCKRGQVWVHQDALSYNIEGFTWLE